MKKIFKIVSGILLGGLMLAACGRHHHHGFSEKNAEKIKKRISSKLDLNESQEKNLDVVFNELKPEFERMRELRKSFQEELLKQLNAGQLDEAALNAKMAEMETQFTSARANFVSQAVRFYSTLNDEQKEEIREKAAKFAERMNDRG
ncbi:MAG: periplasmic heavy metal sensor [Leptospiraceae bacterium]|nr:periplasmic heavy metal sensor [Leptospiraceae bacterium]